MRHFAANRSTLRSSTLGARRCMVGHDDVDEYLRRSATGVATRRQLALTAR